MIPPKGGNDMVRLGDVGKVITGNTPKTSDLQNYTSNDICFVKPSDIADGTVAYLDGSEFYISEYARAKARILPPKSVLVTCIGIIGKVAINNVECAFNQQINAIIPDNSKCLTEYLAYAVQNKQPEMQDIANAPVVPILNKTQFSDIKIKLPSLTDQEEVVDKLNIVSWLISLRQEQLTKLDELVKSRFIELFGDSEQNPRGLPVLPWSKVFLTTTGKLDSNAMVENGQYPFFTCAKESFWIDTYAFDCEALLLAGNNAAGVYDVKHYKGKFNAYQRTYVLRLINDQWSYKLFKRQLEDKLRYLQSQSKGTNTRYLTLGILNELRFVVPPVAEQEQFATFVEQTDKSKLAIQESLAELETLKKALMQKYFG